MKNTLEKISNFFNKNKKSLALATAITASLPNLAPECTWKDVVSQMGSIEGYVYVVNGIEGGLPSRMDGSAVRCVDYPQYGTLANVDGGYMLALPLNESLSLKAYRNSVTESGPPGYKEWEWATEDIKEIRLTDQDSIQQLDFLVTRYEIIVPEDS